MHDIFDLLGIKGQVVAAGLAGGVLRALSRHRYKLREMIASPICGALAAACLTLPVVAWIQASGLSMPDAVDDTTTLAAAFLIGHVDFGPCFRGGDTKVQDDKGRMTGDVAVTTSKRPETSKRAGRHFSETSVNHFMSPGDTSLQMNAFIMEISK